MLFDTHAHLYFENFHKINNEIRERMKTAWVTHSIQVGIDKKTSMEALSYAKKYKNTFSSIGLHPTNAQNMSYEDIDSSLDFLEKIYKENSQKIIAVWEAWLDYYHIDSEKKEEQIQKQIYSFKKQIELSNKYNIRLIIHSREAKEDTLKVIKENNLKRWLIHCFTYDYNFCINFLQLVPDAFFGFTGIATYSNSIKIHETIQDLPLERILIETDSPFLVPRDLRWKTSLNESSYLPFIFNKIHELRPEWKELLEKELFFNSFRCFNIKNTLLT